MIVGRGGLMVRLFLVLAYLGYHGLKGHETVVKLGTC